MLSTRAAPASGLADTRQPRSLPSTACATAAVPQLLWQPAQAPTFSTDSTRESTLMPSMLISWKKHFCLLSADEWRCLGCEIGLQIPLWAQLLAGSLQLQPPIALGAFQQGVPPQPREKMTNSIPPYASVPMPRWHQIYGALITLFPCMYGPKVQMGAKKCSLLQNFSVFLTLHSSFVHLPFQQLTNNCEESALAATSMAIS